MKNSIKAVICALALSASVSFTTSAQNADANQVTGFASGIHTSKNGKLFLNIDKFNDSQTVILLKDTKGNIVYREVVGRNDKKFRRSFDVSQLESGSYTMMIFSNGERKSQPFLISEKQVERYLTIR